MIDDDFGKKKLINVTINMNMMLSFLPKKTVSHFKRAGSAITPFSVMPRSDYYTRTRKVKTSVKIAINIVSPPSLPS
jgi:hypothetical protein